MPDSRQKYKARFKFANSSINSHVITETKAKCEMQNWAWPNTQATNPCWPFAGLTSALILVSRKLAWMHQQELNQPLYYSMQICRVETSELQVSNFHTLSLAVLTRNKGQL